MEYTKIKKIHVAVAGTLSTLLPMEEAEQLEVLILSGRLNAFHFVSVKSIYLFRQNLSISIFQTPNGVSGIYRPWLNGIN